MDKEKFLRFLKSRGTLSIMTLCLVGIVAFATYRTSYQEKQEAIPDTQIQNQLTPQRESETEEKNLEVAGQDVTAQLDQAKDSAEAKKLDADRAATILEDSYDFDVHEEAVDAGSGEVLAQIQPTVNFREDSMLTWPAAGTVLMDYSMDNTVYFETLDQYKYNPALIIGSTEGNSVLASAKGIVESVSVNEETGTTVKLDLGNNYELIYGQLKEVAVSEGDVVEQGELLGYVGEPTKYYCQEGSNLYFQMSRDGQPVDPFLYLE